MSTCPGDGQIDLIICRIRAYLSREFYQASHGIEKFLCRVWRYERQKHVSIMTVANAVEEATKEGKNLRVPYWRTLKSEGFLNEKYPGGVEAHKKLLEKEGLKFMQKGKKYFVENYQDYIE